MNMIEKVVNALYKFDNEYDGPASEIYEAFAKAAIAAMREPTAAMVMAGYNCNIRNSGFTVPDGTSAETAIYQTMIDAALTEEKK